MQNKINPVEKRECIEVKNVRDCILAGYSDILHGRVKKFSGDLSTELEDTLILEAKMLHKKIISIQ